MSTFWIHRELHAPRICSISKFNLCRLLPKIPRASFVDAVRASFLTRLYDIRGEVPPDAATVSNVVSGHVDATVSEVAVNFAISAGDSMDAESEASRNSCDVVKLHVQLCVATENWVALTTLLEKLEVTLVAASENNRILATRIYVIPVLAKLSDADIKSKPSRLVDVTSRILRNAVTSLLTIRQADLDTVLFFDLVQLCRATGNISVCREFLTNMTAGLGQLESASRVKHMKEWYIPLLVKAAGESNTEDVLPSLLSAASQVFYDLVIPALPIAPQAGWTKTVLFVLQNVQDPTLKSAQ